MTGLLARNRVTPADAGLKSARTDGPGIVRRRQGKGFSYISATGSVLAGPARLACEALAVPPAWTDVWISPDPKAHVLAYGSDEAGRRQYIYHPDWRHACEQAKFEDLLHFADRLPRLRARVRRDLGRKQMDRERVLAGLVRLIDHGGLRVGHNRFRNGSGAMGATTLSPETVQVKGTHIEIDFQGKGGRERHVELNDAGLARILKRLAAENEENLFQIEDHRINADEVNDWIGDVMGLAFTAKDFRTWTGSVAAAGYLRRTKDKITLKAMSEAAADRLGNTPAIALSSYIHPVLADMARDGRVIERLAGPARLRKDERACYAAIGGDKTP